KTGFNISPVVYGGIVSMSDGQKNSDDYVSYAYDKGINYFDVAPTYGDAQEKLGNSLKPYRNNVYLACKTAERTSEGAKKEMTESFKLLHTDYFDIYQMHALNTMNDLDVAFGRNGIMNYLIQAKQNGLIRNISFTAHNEEVALKALTLYDFSSVLFPINWGMHLGKEFGGRLSEDVQKKGIGFLGMKTLIHRAWLDESEKKNSRFQKSWCKPISDDEKLGVAALKYTLSLGVNAVVPPGNFESFSFAVEHIDQCMENPLNDSDISYLKEELKKIEGHYFF
ncbi:MAG: Aldo/keto reductase, partial [Clostridia bacterium]|nr:Aldo/keto reductase [Clostridia bacterium]